MLVHATGESAPQGHQEGTYAVVLGVPGEDALSAVAGRLALANVPHVVVREPDAPYHGQAMAIGVAPARKEALRRYLSSLPLLK